MPTGELTAWDLLEQRVDPVTRAPLPLPAFLVLTSGPRRERVRRQLGADRRARRLGGYRVFVLELDNDVLGGLSPKALTSDPPTFDEIRDLRGFIVVAPGDTDGAVYRTAQEAPPVTTQTEGVWLFEVKPTKDRLPVPGEDPPVLTLGGQVLVLK